MKPITLCSNMLNEEADIKEWMEMANSMPIDGIIIVDGGSSDRTGEIAKEMGAIVIIDNTIQREGYGNSRNQLIDLTKEYFPGSEYMLFLDADERILKEDFHWLRVIKDSLVSEFNAVAFPRLDFHNREMTKCENDIHVNPDPQCRMVRVNSNARYVRRLHEQIKDANIYFNINNPKICHFHRCAPEARRRHVSKICAYLHNKDEMKDTYPVHPKEAAAFELYRKEGLTEGLDCDKF